MGQAAENIADVTHLAHRTGVQGGLDLEGSVNKYHESAEAKADIKQYGVRVGPSNDKALVESRGHYDVPVTETEDALIGNAEWTRGDGKPIAVAQTKEKTGKYTTPGIYPQYPNFSAGEKLKVERPDGSGGTYVGKITGSNGEKATAIVANRAAKRVKKAIVDRAISVADELKQEQDRR